MGAFLGAFLFLYFEYVRYINVLYLVCGSSSGTIPY